MVKKPVRKQLRRKNNPERESGFSQNRQRHYAFGFLVGEY